MTNKRVLSAAMFLSSFALGSCGQDDGATVHTVSPERRIEGRYIVVLDDSAKADLAGFVRNFSVGHRYRNVFTGFSASLSAQQLDDLRHDARVRAIHEVGRIRLSEIQSGATWGIDRLDQQGPQLDSKYSFKVTGKDVRAYVIDTGIMVEHPDFGGRAIIGGDFTVDKGTQWENKDGHGHGTHVAGTIGGKTWGVAKDTTLVAVKVFDHSGGEATDETVIAGVDFVVADHQANPAPAVINMSLGGEASQVLDDAVQKAVDAGITTVVAAGNDNQDSCGDSPARIPAVITVAAMGRNDRKAWFSNWGKCIDVIAPGSGITSTWKNGRTSVLDGTSMASPHVAGLAALALAADPARTPAQVQDFLVETSIKDAAKGFNADTPNRIAAALWNVE